MARLFAATELRLGNEATEARLRADPALAGAKIVAFATHGLLANDLLGVDEPGLVFTPPLRATETDDGILTASEAAGLELGADWVILSACNTGSGKNQLASLSRAFLYAGASALLASHWLVGDEVTAALTVETLSVRLANPGMSRAQALRQAMRNVRSGVRPDGSQVAGWTPDWGHPASWGAFSVISNDD
jgi:CHAT domain-containing protein